MDKKEPFYNQIEKWVIIILMIVMLVLLTITIVTRFLFSYTTSWTEQMTRLMLVWISFAGISWAGMLDVHMKVTAVSLLTKKNPQVFEYILIIGDLVATIYCFYLAYRIGITMQMTIEQYQVFTAMPWCPKWVMYLAGVLGMAGCGLRIVQRRVRYFKKRKGAANA
ncbi:MULTISPECIES: TRAP transporter small permease [Anaerotruncus]|uniref:TRAP transporter small permease n=1 Tax=Anaerotruncus TaxID=244127 RepID=UPI001FA90433|nr:MULTISPECIES: TRAP transporter small permease subunit [Anaerotruncus]